MARNLVCSECGGKMQLGYFPNLIFGRYDQLFWVEGQMEKNFLGAPVIKNRKNFYLYAYRCEQCGFLKFYAGPDHSSGKQE